MSQKLPLRRPGRPKQTETSPDTKQFIMRTAAQMFMQQGYEKVSLAQVAKACQLTKASLYYYFDTKAELFTQCVVNVLSFAEIQTRHIVTGDLPIDKKLQLAAIGRMRNAEIEFEAMLGNARQSLSPEQIELIRASEQAIYATIATALQQAIDDGEIRQCDPMLTTHIYTSMLTLRNREHFMALMDNNIERAAEEIIQLLMHGLSKS
ncbi:TetR/AcrR family transcriptional regulator [Paenibacillus yanchengensis]|uniref:TetR/AcrR family transcriptional regulator n=1 Tax=Paenibacillus yanchengensis TaxID=2035833 RepID=A0ABW4YPD3_9BACL